MEKSETCLLFVIACVFTCCGSALGTFFAMTPHEFRPGWPLTISATVFTPVQRPAYVMATLYSGSDINNNALGSDTKSINPGETQLLTIQVPDVVDQNAKYQLHIETTGGVFFSESKAIKLNMEISVVMIQTDKTIYKPGQKVRIRLLNMDSFFKPAYQPLTMTVINPKESKVEEYKDINSLTGVTERIFQLSSNPSLGDWTIQVSQDGVIVHTEKFIVEEFVLPKFSVEVEADPGFIISSATNPGTSIFVKALYTYGKAVQGVCKLRLSTENFQITISKEISESGVAEFTDINWKSILDKFPAPKAINLEAEVKDETGRTEMGESKVEVYKKDIKISILKSSTTMLRNRIEAEVHIKVTDYAGNPIGPVALQMNVVSPVVEDVKATLTVPEGETDITYKYTPIITSREELTRSEIEVFLATDKDIIATMHVTGYQTVNSVSMMAKGPDKPLILGQKAEFTVVTNNDDLVRTSSYAVISNGKITETSHFSGNKIMLTPTLEMCHHGRLVVVMLIGNPNPEVIVDALDLTINGCFTKELDVSFEAAEVRTSTDVNMKIDVNLVNGSNALPGVHDVYYLAVDKSIVLLEGGTDLNKAELLSTLKDKYYPGKLEPEGPYASTYYYFWQLGLLIMKDSALGMTELKAEPEIMDRDYDHLMFDAEIMFKGRNDQMPVAAMADGENVVHINTKQPPSTKVRKNFPDTWLWGHAKTGANGKLSTMVTTPDTITSWMVSAFATNQDGLVVSDGPFTLTTTKLFFLTMNLPYSIKRGEIFNMRITVFNYRDKEVEAVVSLKQTTLFTVMSGTFKDGWYEQTVTMAANRASSVEFKIDANEIGSVEVHTKAEDNEDGQMDEVKRQLLVKPEGEKRSWALTKVLIVDSIPTVKTLFTIPWPTEKIVPGSQLVEVKVTGDIFGQALKNLGSLIQQPFGCGEQNMISTVPNIFGLQYIRKTDETELEEIEKMMLTFMKLGYQRQVDNYKHADGSYSAWGESDGSQGSTWLTAFVIKSFSQASQYIVVDRNVLRKGVSFLKSKQSGSGAFIEYGRVLHSAMQSGSSGGKALTAYVLISMLETTRALGTDFVDLSFEIMRAKGNLESISLYSLQESGNKFLSALTAYALSLIPERGATADRVIKSLLYFVTESGAPWEDVDKSEKKVASGSIRRSRIPSRDIETTAYTLLTYVQLNRIAEGLPLMTWLQKQQNYNGGYRSTQDTVMALQALAEFGEIFSKGDLDGMVYVKDSKSTQTFEINISGSRSILLQTVELASSTQQVEVNFTGDPGNFAVVKVVYTYYTLPGEDSLTPVDETVTLYTKSTKLSRNVHKVEACVQSSPSLKEKGMFVTTMTLPSGEVAMEDTATIAANNPKASKVEVESDAIHFYMDEAPGKGYCLQAQLERDLDFEVQKPGSAKIYAYYEPEIAQEVGLDLETEARICANNVCDRGSAIVQNMSSVLLTFIICALVSLLICM